VAVPVGAQAETSIYARVNNALVFDDTGESTTDMTGVGTRFGIKGSSDLGNGLVAHGQYEFATNTDDAADGVTATRIATAGISGGFGRFDVGNQWSAFYNSTGVHMDPTWTIGPISGATPFRTPNTIKYSNSVGPLALEADLRFGDEGGEGWGNGGGVGISVDATHNLTFAAAYDVDDQTDLVVTPGMDKRPGLMKDDEGNVIDSAGVVILPATEDEMGHDHSRAGVSGKVSFGQFWGSLAWSSHEAEDMKGKTQAEKEFVAGYVGASFTDELSGWIGYSQADVDTLEGEAAKAGHGKEPTKVMAGLYYNVGGGLQFWYEGGSEDHDTDRKANATTETVTHYVGIRYDF